MDSMVARVYYMNMYVVFSSVLTAKNRVQNTYFKPVYPHLSQLELSAHLCSG